MRAILRVAYFLSVMSTPALIIALANPSNAEPDSIGRWLMSKPLTLWDKGMMEARQAAYRAATRLAKDVGTFGGANAKYDWYTNEIEIHLNVFGYRSDLSS